VAGGASRTSWTSWTLGSLDSLRALWPLWAGCTLRPDWTLGTSWPDSTNGNGRGGSLVSAI
jgi:hypothetical protein